MKKNFLYAVIAVFALFFAACSQEELLSNESGNKQVSLTVNVPGAIPNTRANMEVSGYTMRCIMEILDASGTKIGEQKIETVDATTGKATFTFEKPDGAAKYLFWADYLKDGNSFYKTGDLQNIAYSLNKTNDLFNNAASDAFCAHVSDDNLGANVTLKRPFTRLAVKISDLANAEMTNLNKINPSIFAGTNFSVATGTATTAVNIGTASDSYVEALAEGEFAFYCFVFAYPTGETKTSTIKFTSDTDATGKSLSISADQMQGLGANTSVNLVPNKPEDPSKEITVEVVIDNTFKDGTQPENPGTGEEPEEPVTSGELAVGSYINAAGEVVTDASQAVAVVFALADGKTDNSDYGTGKTAKAYAVALEQKTGRVAMGDLASFSLETTADDSEAYSGYKFDAALKAKLGSVTTEQSKLFNAYYTASLTELTGENLSSWYIPTKTQLADALQCEQMKDILAEFPATGSGAFIGATSSVNNGLVLGVTYTIGTQAISGTGSPINSNASAIILPILTIFE